jgi:plasmid stabilization system protein ParE
MNFGAFGSSAQDNPDAATRVIEAAYKTFKTLAGNPGIGRVRRFRNPRLRDIRSWHITGFENYLIFYRGVTNGIQVNHVYHGARNIEALLKEK